MLENMGDSEGGAMQGLRDLVQSKVLLILAALSFAGCGSGRFYHGAMNSEGRQNYKCAQACEDRYEEESALGVISESEADELIRDCKKRCVKHSYGY